MMTLEEQVQQIFDKLDQIVDKIDDVNTTLRNGFADKDFNQLLEQAKLEDVNNG